MSNIRTNRDEDLTCPLLESLLAHNMLLASRLRPLPTSVAERPHVKAAAGERFETVADDYRPLGRVIDDLTT